MVGDAAQKYCVIGAGPSGLAAVKNLHEQGLSAECLEREDDVGGTWYYGKPASAVYRSTHLISSKPLTEFPDFPMPAHYPDYPSHVQAWDYLRSYARHFGLYQSIQFRSAVEHVAPIEPHVRTSGWQVRLASGERRRYRGLIIANGHNWDPRWPDYPGHFEGLSLHSSQYKTPDVLCGRRVLVVGAGNSGCDIAVEAAQNAARTLHSTRRGYHYLPKYVAGKPADQVGERLLRWRLPLGVRRAVAGLAARLVLGPPARYGLPAPDHKLFETHPIINSQMLYYVGHGVITPKPDVAELCTDQVRFADGSLEPVDVIVYATGFRISFPFIDRCHLNWDGGRPELHLNVFHPHYDTLFVAGLIQPDSGQWGLVDCQAQLVARYLAAFQRNPAAAGRFRRRLLRLAPAKRIRYVNSSRHLLEVEHFSYRRRLQKLIRQFG